MIVRHPDRAGVAKLRMLLIDPSARGLGLGKRLVEECTTFARAAGYHTITLWTNSILTTARAIYQRAGYQLVQSAPEPNFGKDLVDGDLVRVTQREAVDPVLRIGIEPRALRWMVEGTLDVQQAFKDKRVALEDPDLLIRRFVACFEPAGSALGLRLGASKPRKTR